MPQDQANSAKLAYSYCHLATNLSLQEIAVGAMAEVRFVTKSLSRHFDCELSGRYNCVIVLLSLFATAQHRSVG